MKFWSNFQLYACGIVAAVAAVLWYFVDAIHTTAWTAFFLALASAAYVIGERERMRQRECLKKELRRGHRS